MSYGTNKPWGLQATKTLNGASWNGQVNPYLIRSGYANNIFRGDPVIIGGENEGNANLGYVCSLYDFSGVNQNNNTNYRTAAVLGVFDGCEFTYPTATNNIDPASPGKQSWVAGTVTFGSLPATAYIIDDPSVVFNVQTNGDPGISQSAIGGVAPVVFPLVAVTGGVVDGDTFNGTSKVSLNQGQLKTAADNALNMNLKILRLVADKRNFDAQPFNNVEVIIQNHFYCSRPLNAQ